LTPDPMFQAESLLRAVARAPRSLLMLDYDGTLAPFRTDPDEAFPYPGISSVLHDIVQVGKTRVVIISGRDAREILPLLDIDPHPEIWGLHGLQRLKVDGSIEVSLLEPPTVAALTEADSWLVSQDLEQVAEFKPGSIAVHWRGFSNAETAVVRKQVLWGWMPIAQRSGLVLLEFDGGVEIRAPEADKGDAVQTLMSEMNADTPAAYLGDDNTDEHAFQAMNGRGLSVLVRPRWRATSAQLWLRPPDQVLDLLTRWLQACRNRDMTSDSTIVEVSA
jgi:trehalose 6-phosphate phosphatase